jgi:hypothetical protein
MTDAAPLDVEAQVAALLGADAMWAAGSWPALKARFGSAYGRLSWHRR